MDSPNDLLETCTSSVSKNAIYTILSAAYIRFSNASHYGVAASVVNITIASPGSSFYSLPQVKADYRVTFLQPRHSNVVSQRAMSAPNCLVPQEDTLTRVKSDPSRSVGEAG